MKKMFFMLCAFCAIGAIFLMVGCSLQAYNPENNTNETRISFTITVPEYFANRQGDRSKSARLIHPDSTKLKAVLQVLNGETIGTREKSLTQEGENKVSFDNVPYGKSLQITVEVFDINNGVLGTGSMIIDPLGEGANTHITIGIKPANKVVKFFPYNEQSNLLSFGQDPAPAFENKFYIFCLTGFPKGIYNAFWLNLDHSPSMTLWNSDGTRYPGGLVEVADSDLVRYFFYSNGEDAYITVQGSEDSVNEISFNINKFDESLVLTYPYNNDDGSATILEDGETTYLGSKTQMVDENYYPIYDENGKPVYTKIETPFTIHNPYPFVITLQNDASISYLGVFKYEGDVSQEGNNPDAFSILPAILPKGTTIPAGGKKEFTVKYDPTYNSSQGEGYEYDRAEIKLNFDNGINFTCTLSGSASL